MDRQLQSVELVEADTQLARAHTHTHWREQLEKVVQKSTIMVEV